MCFKHSKNAIEILFFLVLILCSDRTALSAESFKYVSSDNEQPVVAPQAVVSENGYILLGDDIDRKAKLFRIPNLDTILVSMDYPQGVESFRSFEKGDKDVIGLDSNGTRYSIGVIDQFDSISPTVEFKVELNDAADKIVVSNNDLLKEIEASPDSHFVDWEIIATNQDEAMLVITESDLGELRARCYLVTTSGLQNYGSYSWNEFEYIPETSLVLDSSKKAWVFSLKAGTWIHSLDDLLNDEPSAPEPGSASDYKSALEEIADFQQRRKSDPAIQLERSAADYDTLDLAMLLYSQSSDFNLIEEGGLTRQQIVSRALQYYSLPFFYRKRNSVSDKAGWERPIQLNGSIGTWQTGFRYYWSGYMSPARHQLGLIEGHTVGDIDTSEIISDGLVGCDCSGCVSAWLGIPRHTTTGIANDESNIFEKVSLYKTKPGDIFNRKGKHVRMLLNKIVSDTGTKFRTIESAKSCGGVCIRVYSAKELASYTPLRYKLVKE